MTTPDARLVVVSTIPPAVQSTHGFSARLYHFIRASQERMDVQWIWLRRSGDTTAVAARPNPHLIIDVDEPLYVRGTTLGQLHRRLVHYPFGRLPFDCYPRTLPPLRDALAKLR